MENIKYFGLFDLEGFPIGFYPTLVWDEETIPNGAVEITESQWKEFLSNGGGRRWDGDKVVHYTPPLPEPEPVTEVTMRQAKIILSRHGYLSQIDSIIESMPGQEGEEARVEWQYATSLRRDHPLLDVIAVQLELTEQEIDDMFTEASTI